MAHSKRWLWVATLALVAYAAGCDAGENCGPGQACVFAGTGRLELNGDGLDSRATSFYWPLDAEFAPDGRMWILDWNNHRVRVLENDDTFHTVVGDFVGDGPKDLSDLMDPGAPGDTVNLNHPTDIQFADDGTLIFAAWHNHKLRHVDPVTGRVLVVCGRGGGFAGDGGDAAKALFNQPKAIVRAPDGAIFILDQRNQRIRKISGGAAPTIATVVGAGMPGFSGDGGAPLAAQLNFEAGGNPEPSGAITLGSSGELYISDGLNHRIRKVDFIANTITTIAGTGTAGFSGDGSAATSAEINNARDLELGPDGRLYFADTENHRIRVIDLATGIIDTVVGSGTMGTKKGLLLSTELNRPFGIAFDASGDLYISDTFNSRILKVTL